jgi:lactoylglutathione lyase
VAGAARLIGINHVAIEVGDIDEALDFYQRVFRFELREHQSPEPWINLGDQVVALFEGRDGTVDGERHFGLVVDDLDAVREALESAGVPFDGGAQLDFHDPWGNRVQVGRYGDTRYRKDPEYLSELLGDA